MKTIFQKSTYFILPLTYILAGVIFCGDHSFMLPIILTTCFLVAYFLKERPKRQPLWAFLPLWLLILAPSIIAMDFKRSILYLVCIPLAVVVGRWAQKAHFIPKLIFTIGFALFLGKYGYPSMLLALTDDSTFYETKPFPSDLVFLDKHKDTIRFDQKITVLDFWNTACKPCFEKFPYYEKISEKYQHPEIAFYSVNIPLKNQTFEARTHVAEKLNYSYTTLYGESMKTVQEALDFNAYPHLIILKDSTMIYSGNFVTGESIYIDNLDRQLQKIVRKQDLQF